MRSLKQHLLSRLAGFALLLLALAGTGCRTAQPLFMATGPGWRMQEGQAIWRPSRTTPELAGDLVAGRNEDGRWFLEFSKSPLPLVSAQHAEGTWWINFAPRRMAFRFHHRPMNHFTWLYLPEALAGEPVPAPLKFEKKPGGAWLLENTKSGEKVEGFLAP
jgi:hypothetical protein